MEQHFRNIYPNFRKLSSGSFLSAFNFAPECLKFLVEWVAFRKRFRKSENFSGKILYQLPLFLKFLKFWVNGKHGFFLGRRFLGRRLLGHRFLGRRFLGRCFLGRRFLGRTSSFSRSSFSRHPEEKYVSVHHKQLQ